MTVKRVCKKFPEIVSTRRRQCDKIGASRFIQPQAAITRESYDKYKGRPSVDRNEIDLNILRDQINHQQTYDKLMRDYRFILKKTGSKMRVVDFGKNDQN